MQRGAGFLVCYFRVLCSISLVCFVSLQCVVFASLSLSYVLGGGGGGQALAGFASMVETLQAVDGAQSIDLDMLPTPEALETPGKKHGETVVINVPGRGAIAYSWNGEEKSWIEVCWGFARCSFFFLSRRLLVSQHQC